MLSRVHFLKSRGTAVACFPAGRLALAGAIALGAVLVGAALAPEATAQEQADGSAEKLVVRVYRLADLVTPVPSHPYRGLEIPSRSGGAGGGLLGGGGFGGGQAGGGGGGGMFDVKDDVLAQLGGLGGGGYDPRAHQQDADSDADAEPVTIGSLIELIQNTVAPESWPQAGGPGTLTRVGYALVIKQSPSVHKEIEALLTALRAEGGALSGVSIKATWIRCTAQQLDEARYEAGRQPGDPLVLDPEAMGPLSNVLHQGQIHCFDRQRVHILSGRLRTIVEGVTPVVGGNQVGYQPHMSQLHEGALLDIRPSLVGGADRIILDLKSVVTQFGKQSEEIELSIGKVDRANLRVHQLASTIQAPLGYPVVAGGLTLESEDGAADATGLYLIIEAQARKSADNAGH